MLWQQTKIAAFNLILLLAALAFILPTSGIGAAPAKMRQAIHHGIKIVALPPAPGKAFDVPLTRAEDGLRNLKAALNFIDRHSPYNMERINFLRKVGNVFMIYDPNFPAGRLHKGKFGLFNSIPPNAVKGAKSGNRAKDYVMIVGRHGIKWPVRELAGIIVHELVGHGIQHYRGRLHLLPELDRECEAWLYHEKAHQDFKVDKRSRNMVNFRQNLELKICVGFKRYLKNHHPRKIDLWENINPDVPRLLEIFEIYASSLLSPELRIE